MFLGNVTNWTSVVGQNIPFTTVLNTNNRTKNDNGLISFKRSGYYNIDCALNLVGAGEVIVSVIKDGVEDPTTYAETEITTDVADGNVAIVDAIKVVLNRNIDDLATIALRVDTAGITVSGKLRIEYVQ